MNSTLLIIGIILVVIGIFTAIEAPTLYTNQWCSFLGQSTIDGITEAATFTAVIGLILIALSVMLG